MKPASLLAHLCLLVSIAGFSILSTGCSKPAEDAPDATGEAEHADEGGDHEGHDHDGDDHDHDGDAAESASE